MSLLYKALNQASRLRESGSVKSGAPAAERAGAAASVPLAERLLAQGSAAAGKGGPMRIARMVLFGLVGLSALAIGAALLLPASPPELAAGPDSLPAPEPALPATPEPAPTPVQEVAQPVPAEAVAQQSAPAESPPAPEPSIAEAADSLAEALDAEAAVQPAPPARISAGSEPAEPQPKQKRVRDGGLEDFVDEQVARESMAGLGAPVNIDRGSGSENIGQRSPVEITNDTDIARERYETAALMLERDQPEESLRIYDQLLRNNPRDRLALLGRAASLQKLGRNLMAVSAYEEVLTAFPGDEWALVNLLSLISAQEPQRALAQLERLQRLNPATALLPAQMGMIQMAQGNYEMAARSMEKAISLDPENAKYVFNLAVLYDKWGQPKSALRYYRQVLEMASQNPDGQIPMETVRSRMAFLDVK